MRISGVQKNNTNFSSLQVRTNSNWRLKQSEIKRFEKQLASTEKFDVIIDSHGFAIKEKMTDVLKRIQSFSLFPKENAVSVNMIGEHSPEYKFIYKDSKEARDTWDFLNKISENESNLSKYTKVTLWLEQNLKKTKN